MMIKFIIAMFLSLVAVNAQQSDAEKNTKHWIEQTQNIKDDSLKEAVHLFIKNILLDAPAFNSIIINDQYNSARKFVETHSRMIAVKGSEFPNFGIAITGILEKMTQGQLALLQQSSNTPERTWYQQVIYILWNIKFYKTEALAKELLGITPLPPDDSILPIPRGPVESPYSRPGSAFPPPVYHAAPATGRAAPHTDVTGSSPGSFPPPIYTTLPTLRAGGVPYPETASLLSPFVDEHQRSIPSDQLLQRISENVSKRQTQWRNQLESGFPDQFNLDRFRDLLEQYHASDTQFIKIRNLNDYLTGRYFDQDKKNMYERSGTPSFRQALSNMARVFEGVEPYKNIHNQIINIQLNKYNGRLFVVLDRLSSSLDDARSTVARTLNQSQTKRSQTNSDVRQWLIQNKEILRQKINGFYQEIQGERFLDYISVNPLTDGFRSSGHSSALANVGTLRIADVFGISDYPYSVYFDRLIDFTKNVRRFSRFQPSDRELTDSQKIRILCEIMKTMRHMQSYQNILTPMTRTLTYQASSRSVIWNSHMLVLSLQLAFNQGLLHKLEAPNSRSREALMDTEQITVTIAQSLEHFYDLLKKSPTELLEVKMVQDRLNVLGQYQEAIRTFAGASTAATAAAGSPGKRERGGDVDSYPSKRFHPEDPTTTPGPAHNPRAPLR